MAVLRSSRSFGGGAVTLTAALALMVGLLVGRSWNNTQVASCNQCNSDRFSSTTSHYDEKYLSWQLELNKKYSKDQVHILLNRVAHKTGRKHVLEVGCGPGYTLAAFPGADTKQCLEINLAATAHIARTHSEAHISVSTTWDEIPDSSVDFAYSFDSLEHHPSPLDSLLSLHKKLMRGGEVYIQVPFDHAGVISAVSGVYGRKFYPGDKHNHLFTWNSLLLGNLLTAAGFEVIECFDAEKSNMEMRENGLLEPAYLEKINTGLGTHIEKINVWCQAIRPN